VHGAVPGRRNRHRLLCRLTAGHLQPKESRNVGPDEGLPLLNDRTIRFKPASWGTCSSQQSAHTSPNLATNP
jgi:hypothetical protein